MIIKKIRCKNSRKNLWPWGLNFFGELLLDYCLSVFCPLWPTEPQSSLRYTCSTTEGNMSIPRQVRVCVFADIVRIVYISVVMHSLWNNFCIPSISCTSSTVMSLAIIMLSLKGVCSSNFPPLRAYLPYLNWPFITSCSCSDLSLQFKPRCTILVCSISHNHHA